MYAIIKSGGKQYRVQSGEQVRVEALDADVTSVESARSQGRILAERAVAMAKVSPEDPYQGLADETLLAKDIVDLDLFDRTDLSADQLREAALEAEQAALAVKGVTNSGGSSAAPSTSGRRPPGRRSAA